MSKMQPKAGFVLAIILGTAPHAFGAQTPQQTQPASAQVSQDQGLKERATEYYRDLLNGENAAAFAFVAPQSKNEFFKLHAENLIDVRILDVQLADAPGSSATIKVQKSIKPMQFNQNFDFQYVETWKKIDGQWYIVIPKLKDMDSPFGRMFNAGPAPAPSGAKGTSPSTANSSQPGSSAAPDLAEIQKRAASNAKNADPDQYLLALKKAMVQAQAQSAKDPKSDDKDKKKTDPTQDSTKPKQNN
jgi:hypothetical protein